MLPGKFLKLKLLDQIKIIGCIVSIRIVGGDHFAVEHYRGIQIPEHGIAVGQIVDYQRSAAFRGFFIEFDGIVIVSGTVVGISLPAVVFECMHS